MITLATSVEKHVSAGARHLAPELVPPHARVHPAHLHPSSSSHLQPRPRVTVLRLPRRLAEQFGVQRLAVFHPLHGGGARHDALQLDVPLVRRGGFHRSEDGRGSVRRGGPLLPVGLSLFYGRFEKLSKIFFE